MIHAELGIDFFSLGSISAEEGRLLAPKKLSPVIFEEKAWIVFAFVNFKESKFGKIPMPSNMLHCSFMLYVKQDSDETICGNYFLSSFTSFLPLSLAMRLINPHLFQYSSKLLLEETNFKSPLLNADYQPVVDEKKEAKLQQLFSESKCGFMQLKTGLSRTHLEKSHWDMHLVELKNETFEAPSGMTINPTWEFSFLTSNSSATWQLPQPIN
jgi:hypothetical protein